MDEASVETLQVQLRRVPVPAFLTELPTRTLLAANDAVLELLGVAAGDIIGRDVTERVHPRDREDAERAQRSLAEHVVDGYQAVRSIVRPDGGELRVNVIGRRVETHQGPLGLWMLTPASDKPARELVGPVDDVVLALTDHDWLLAYVSASAHLLGAAGPALVGSPLLGFVHPSVAAEFLEAASRSVSTRMAITVATRLRVGEDSWAARYCLLVPMCEHDPPRLGVVVTERPAANPDDLVEIDSHVRHAALETHATNVLRALPSLMDAQHPELSVRQLEVLSRVIAGDGIDEIGRTLFLSSSTVRNHLTAIYRKFGVHSRAELLSRLLRSMSEHEA